MKKIKTILISVALYSLFTALLPFLFQVFGQEATNAGDISDETIKENIRERLEKVVKEDNPDILQAATSQKRAWAGNLQDISNQTLTIKTLSDTKQAKVAEDATILDANRQPIKAENLEIDSFVIAMGFLDNNSVLDTKRIVVTEEPEPNPLDAYLVKITQIQDDTLTVVSLQDQNLSWQLAITKDTDITQTVDGEQTEIELSDLKQEDRLVIIAEPDPNAPTTLDTVAIQLADGREILAEPEEATPSAEDE